MSTNSATPDYPVIPPGPGTTQVGIMYPFGNEGFTINLYRGCNSKYAMSNSNVIDMTDGWMASVPPEGTYGVTVTKGHTIKYEVFPASGFMVHAFYDYDNPSTTYPPTRDGTSFTKNNIQEPLVICPNFVPLNPTYNRNITVNVSGTALFNAVEITSMLGYYEYTISSPETGVEQRVFNRYGLNPNVKPYELEELILPDNKAIYIKVKKKSGYTATLKVDGVEQTPYSISEGLSFSNYSHPDLDSEEQHTRAIDEPNPEIVTEQEPYIEYRIPNSTTNKCTIDIVYTENTSPEMYRVGVRTDNGGGTVQVWDAAVGPTGSGTDIHVEEGSNVVVKATPNTDYEFLMWKASNGWTSNSATDTFENVQENIVFVAYFTKSSTSITVRQDPRSGEYGTAYIQINGTQIASRVINSADYTDSDVIELVAVPAPDTSLVEYDFIRWSCTATEVRSLSPDDESDEPRRSFIDYNDTDPVIRVGFDDVKDLLFTAHFSAKESGTVNFNGHTSTKDGNTFSDGPDQPLYLGVKYPNTSGGITTLELDATGETFTAKLTNDGTLLKATLTLSHNNDDYIYTNETTGERYLYHFEGYYYREIISDSVHPNWELIEPVNNTWTWSVPANISSNRIPTVELVAAYSVTPIYIVKVRAISEERDDFLPSNYVNFEVTKNGQTYNGDMFQYGDTVTVTATVASGVSDRFTFDKWTKNGDDLSIGNPSCSFTVEEDTLLYAVYHEVCRIDVVASPQAGGTAKVENASYAYITYGGSAHLVATAASGYTFVEWRKGGALVSQEPSFTIDPVTNISPVTYTAKFIQSSKKLRVMKADGGTVRIEVQENGSQDWNTPEPTSSNSSYDEYTIETGSRICATAIPNTNYSFDGYTLYDTANQQNTEQNSSRVFYIDNLNVDKTLVPSFKYIPWISTLSAIIKVY